MSSYTLDQIWAEMAQSTVGAVLPQINKANFTNVIPVVMGGDVNTAAATYYLHFNKIS